MTVTRAYVRRERGRREQPAHAPADHDRVPAARHLRFQAPIISGHMAACPPHSTASRARSSNHRSLCSSVVSPSARAPGRTLRYTAPNIALAAANGSSRPATSVPSGAPIPASAKSRGRWWPARLSQPAASNAPEHDAPELVDRLELRLDVARLDVVVLDHEVPARRDPVPQVAQHAHAVVHVEQQQASEDEVERPAGDPAGLRDVGVLERALVVAGGVERAKRLGAERSVDVDAHHPALGADALGHHPHRLAGPAAGVEAARAGAEPDLVEEPRRGGLPHAGLGPQALVLLGGASERVFVNESAHAAMLDRGRRARIVDDPTIFRRAPWR